MKNTWTIYHNPKCSKSREALEILNTRGINPLVIEYLKTPLNISDLKNLLSKLNIPAKKLVRVKEELYEKKPFDLDSEKEVLENLEKYPALLERPIVVYENEGIIARPPAENLEKLLKK